MCFLKAIGSALARTGFSTASRTSCHRGYRRPSFAVRPGCDDPEGRKDEKMYWLIGAVVTHQYLSESVPPTNLHTILTVLDSKL